MTEEQHKLNVQNNQQVVVLNEISSKIDLLLASMKEMVSLERELLTFFVALDKREMGMDDTNSQEYLTELRKDGFEPKRG